jgi:outer membrane biosynthesis protein TonB
MSLFNFTTSSRWLSSIAAAALIATPVIVLADASAPSVMKAKPKKRMAPKPRMRAKPVARAVEAPKPVMAEPAAEVVQAAEPAPQPEPPAQVAEAPPAPTQATPAPVAAKKGGVSSLLYVGGFAAAIGGIIAATSRGNDLPKSP